MTKTQLITVFTLFLIAIACKDFNSVECELEEIKKVGDREPFVALAQYDSLQGQIGSASEYIRNKYALLGLRLRDKALLLHTSDSCIRRLVPYFEKKGTVREKQEVYYYAGSVYRDLKDTPRSLEYFLLSAECADKGEADSVLLRNCYSQLYGLFFNVQDYIHALEYARKECVTAEKVGILDDISLMHMANAYVRVDSCKEALMIARDVLEIDKKMSPSVRNADLLYSLLYMFCSAREKECAQECLNIIRQDNYGHENEGNRLLSMAEYYRCMGLTDSCIQCFQLAVDKGDTLCRYDASRNLFYLCDRLGYKDTAYKYASEYVDVSSNYDLGRRQELAATANNQYKYYRDKQEEEKIKEERRFLAIIARAAGILCIIITVISIALFYYQKYKRARRLLGIANSLKITNQLKREKEQELFNEEKLVNAITENIVTTKEEKERIENELAKTTERITELTESLKEARLECDAKMNALKEKEEELQQNKQTLHNKINDITIIDLQLQRSEQELREKTILLEEKLKQNESLFRMLHLSDLHGNASVVIDSIKKAADGKEILSDGTWKQFITAVDNLYPHYHNDVIDKLGTLKTEQLRVCYLLKAGLSNTQILNLITDASRATIWRWIRRYNTLLSDSINSI